MAGDTEQAAAAADEGDGGGHDAAPSDAGAHRGRRDRAEPRAPDVGTRADAREHDDAEEDGDDDDDGEGEPAQGAHWAAYPRERVHGLIVQQIPSYAIRPYLRDRRDLRRKIAGGLEHALHGDFCWSLSFAPRFIERLCFEGFLPICTEIAGGTGLYVLLPKLHARRCVLDFASLHVGKSTRKRAGCFTLSVSRAFDRVVSGCIAQHGEDWLHPPMRAVLTTLFERARARPEHHAARPDADGSGAAAAHGARGVAGGSSSSAGGGARRAAAHTAMASFELWDSAGELVAGEIGCVNGRCYTSFSGFHSPAASGSGTVQLVLTARVLELAGFDFWDLGQEFEYKSKLGASVIPRDEFLRRFRAARSEPSSLRAVGEDTALLRQPSLLLRPGSGARASNADDGGGAGPVGASDAGRDGGAHGESAERPRPSKQQRQVPRRAAGSGCLAAESS